MIVRMACETDFERWLPLWKGYQQFYKADISEKTTAVTWARFLDVTEPMHAKANESGASRVWWLTHETNTDAMLLYDRIAAKSGFVQYRKLL
jgi:hypothetical protein